MLKKVLACALLMPTTLVFGYQSATPVADTTSAIETLGVDRPLYYTREITAKDLKHRSLTELALMRNTIYARAGNKFRKKWLNDFFSTQPWYRPLDQMDESMITPLDRKNAEIIAKYDAGITREELLTTLQALDGSTPLEKLELRLVSMRLGKWAGAADDDRTPLEDPSLLDKQLSIDQLKDFSRRDLRLLRNLIYARRGRPFHSQLIKEYFAAVDWYKADPAYSDARLTDLDKRNINVILSLENQLGGPLTDYEHKREDGWFSRS